MPQQIEPRRSDESIDAWSRRVSGVMVGAHQYEEMQQEGGIRGLQSLAQKVGQQHDVSFTEERGRHPGSPCPTCHQPETCDVGRLALGVHRLIFLMEHARKQAPT